MPPQRKRRLIGLVVIASGVGLALLLVLRAFDQNLMFFFSPSEVAAGQAPTTRDFRVGGLVVANSVERKGLQVRFAITDLETQITVHYQGILPDLFREGQGIIARGSINKDGRFTANQVLAKHDETYMPPEVGDMLRQQQSAASIRP